MSLHSTYIVVRISDLSDRKKKQHEGKPHIRERFKEITMCKVSNHAIMMLKIQKWPVFKDMSHTMISIVKIIFNKHICLIRYWSYQSKHLKRVVISV